MRHVSIAVAAATLLLVTGCVQTSGSLTPGPTVTASIGDGPVGPSGGMTEIATGLDAPWSMVRLDSGSTLISERDSRRIKELEADGTIREVGVVGTAAPGGEGGLLGIEFVPGETAAAESADGGAETLPGAEATNSLYAYLTTDDDNRIVRFDLEGDAGSYWLGASSDVLTGIKKANNHNGGRIKLGPDDKLYATVGDAGDRNSAQDPDSLNGKILRMNPDGSVPEDNPASGSLVYTSGHRNPQGIAWDADGNAWAAEFGQNTWDELNVLDRGANYGWPEVEGTSGERQFVDPVYQWPTDDASPSGLAYVSGTFFMAGLGGERLWSIQPGEPTEVSEWFRGQFGRIRDVIPGPDGSVWIMTNNTDGRGDPRDGDDRIVQIDLGPAG